MKNYGDVLLLESEGPAAISEGHQDGERGNQASWHHLNHKYTLAFSTHLTALGTVIADSLFDTVHVPIRFAHYGSMHCAHQDIKKTEDKKERADTCSVEEP